MPWRDSREAILLRNIRESYREASNALMLEDDRQKARIMIRQAMAQSRNLLYEIDGKGEPNV